MNQSQQSIPQESGRRRVAPLTVVLALVMSFFCGVLVFVYVETKRANPVMLDQQGHPRAQGEQPKQP